jgi:hypothetical protein
LAVKYGLQKILKWLEWGAHEWRLAQKHAKEMRKLRNFSMKQKGMYCLCTRMMACLLTCHGVATDKVRHVIIAMGGYLGIKVDQKMSKRTVANCILEGSILSDLQVAAEMATSDSLTLSSDSTSHKRENFDFLTVGLAITLPDGTKQHVQQTCGVGASVNHTASLQRDNILKTLDRMSTLFNESPLAKELNLSFSLDDFAMKFVGTSGDHATDQMKTHKMLGEWKEGRVNVRLKALAEQAISQIDPLQFTVMHMEVMGRKIEELGGNAVWSQLSAIDCNVLADQFMQETGRSLALLELPEFMRLC